MKLSIYDLAYEYFTMFWPANKPIPEVKKTEIITNFWELLAGGWTADELMSYMMQQHADKPGVEPTQGSLLVFFSNKRRTRQNILSPGVAHIHSELRITPPAPVIEIDENTGEVRHEDDIYYMEFLASYTIEDLVTYYSWAVKTIRPNQRNRYLTVFKNLVKTYGIDKVLFMIDVISNKLKTGDMEEPQNPLAIEDYHKEAVEIMNECLTELTENGGLNVVYRPRVPMDRGRSRTAKVSS